jgi:hypothetical protein
VVVHFGVFSFVTHKGKFAALHTVKAYRGVEVHFISFFALAVDVVSGHLHTPDAVPL